jgi:hypothetical protein
VATRLTFWNSSICYPQFVTVRQRTRKVAGLPKRMKNIREICSGFVFRNKKTLLCKLLPN